MPEVLASRGERHDVELPQGGSDALVRHGAQETHADVRRQVGGEVMAFARVVRVLLGADNAEVDGLIYSGQRL